MGTGTDSQQSGINGSHVLFRTLLRMCGALNWWQPRRWSQGSPYYKVVTPWLCLLVYDPFSYSQNQQLYPTFDFVLFNQFSKGQAGHKIFPPFRNISSHAKSISMVFPKVGAKPTGQGGSAPIRSDGGCGVDLTGPTCLAPPFFKNMAVEDAWTCQNYDIWFSVTNSICL